MNRHPFTLQIFVVDGDPTGLRVIERTNWTGKLLLFPRALLPTAKQRPELAQTGVYLLLGPLETEDGDKLYVGEGDPVRARLESHFAQKDFWDRAVVITAGPGHLNKAHVQFLEAQLLARARVAKRSPLDNGNYPADPTLSESERANMNVFLAHVLEVLPVLGIHAFEEVDRQVLMPEAQDAMFCRGTGIEARGFPSSGGFVVLEGSGARGTPAPSMIQHARAFYDQRQRLIESGVLIASGDQYKFSQDFVFRAPSTAAAVVLGRNANGLIEWKTSAGVTLKDLQAKQVAT